jgi:hypothetical protein
MGGFLIGSQQKLQLTRQGLGLRVVASVGGVFDFFEKVVEFDRPGAHGITQATMPMRAVVMSTTARHPALETSVIGLHLGQRSVSRRGWKSL